jgi:hypothetical protein
MLLFFIPSSSNPSVKLCVAAGPLTRTSGSNFNVLLFQETTVVHGQLQALEGINSFAFCLRRYGTEK